MILVSKNQKKSIPSSELTNAQILENDKHFLTSHFLPLIHPYFTWVMNFVECEVAKIFKCLSFCFQICSG